MFKKLLACMLVFALLVPNAMVVQAATPAKTEPEVTAQAAPAANRTQTNSPSAPLTGEQLKQQLEERMQSASPWYYSRYVGNDYIEFCVSTHDDYNYYDNPTGRFTIGNVGGNPSTSSDDDKILLFGHGDPSTSFSTIRINGSNYKFTADNTTFDETRKTATSTMTINNILITQKLEIVENRVSRVPDTVRISYTAQNNSASTQDVGVRIMLDTMLGDNDGAPFKVPAVGNLTTELELVGNNIPTSWQATDSYDNPSVFSTGTFITPGERRPDKVQFAYWPNIYDTMWTYTVDPTQYVTSDSAVGIYWNPQALPAGASTTVSTYYGVGYAGTGGEDSSAQIPRNGFAILVSDKDSNPIQGAKVRATNITGSPEVITDDAGQAVFNTLPSGRGNTRNVELSVSKDGYLSTDVARQVERGGFAGVTLYPDDGEMYATSVVGTIDGSSLDLLSKTKYFKSNPSGIEAAEDGCNVKDFVIRVEAASNTNIDKYQLLQGGRVVLESSRNTFTIPVLTGTPTNPTSFGSDWRITKLSAGKRVYLRLVDETGHHSELISLGLAISEPVTYGFTDTKGSMSLGKDFKVKVPSDVPFLGDTEIELGWKSLPFEFEVFEDGKVKFAINVPLVDYKSTTITGGAPITDWSAIEEGYSEAVESFLSQKAFSSEKLPFKTSAFDFNVNLMGYGEGFMDEYGNLHVSVGLVLTAKQEGSYTWSFFLGYVPVFVSVGETISLSGSGEISALLSNGGIDISGAVGEINFKAGLNADAGVGANKVLNIRVSGRATFSWLTRLTDNYSRASLTGSVYVIAEAFLFKAEKKLAESTWTIYDSYNQYSLPSSGYALPNLYDTSIYTPVERDYLHTPYAALRQYMGEGVVRPLVYPGAAPTLVNVGNTAYLFWLEDIETRSDNDRTALVYSKSTNMTDWTDPVQVIPETELSTADYSYDVCVDGTNIHIAISKANRRFEDQLVDINNLAASAEIYYTKLNTATGTTSPAVRLTNNTCSETMPSVTVNGNTVVVAYTENDMGSGDLFGNNTYRIGRHVVGGATNFFNVDGLVASLSAGQLNGTGVIAYVVDSDRDFNTTEDTTLWLATGTQTAKVENSGNAVSPNYARLNNQSILLWYAEDGIRYLTHPDAEAATLYSIEDGCPVANSFLALNDDAGNLKLVWESMSAIEGSDYTEFNAVDLINGTWSNPYVLSKTDNEMIGVSSGFCQGNAVNLAYLKTWTEYDTTRSSLCAERISPEFDIQLVAVDYDQNTVTPGETLPMTLTIRNNGTAPVDTINILADGYTVATITDAALGRGEAKDYLINDYYVDDGLSYLQNICITAAVDNDRDWSDNQQDIVIGLSDIQVSCTHTIVNQDDCLSVVVTNPKNVPANTTLRVFADEENGALLYERTISNLASGEAQTILLNLDRIDPSCSINVFYIVATAAENELVLFNNSSTVYMAGLRETSYNLSVTAALGGTITSSVGGTFPQGEVIEISATPSKGYVFSHWSSDGEGTFADANAASTTFTMPGCAANVVANFIPFVHDDHVFTQYIYNNDATCLEDGTQTAECNFCLEQNTILAPDTRIPHRFEWFHCCMCGLPAAYAHEDRTSEVLNPAQYPYPESEHDYSNNLYDTKVFTCPGAEAIELTFSDETRLENGCDYLYVMDGWDRIVYDFTGQEAAGETIVVLGDTVKIQLETDISVSYYGFSFTSISRLDFEHAPSIGCCSVCCDDTIFGDLFYDLPWGTTIIAATYTNDNQLVGDETVGVFTWYEEPIPAILKFSAGETVKLFFLDRNLRPLREPLVLFQP